MQFKKTGPLAYAKEPVMWQEPCFGACQDMLCIVSKSGHSLIEYIQDLMTINDGTIQKSLLSVDAVDNIQIGAKYSFGNYKVSFPSIVYSGADE